MVDKLACSSIVGTYKSENLGERYVVAYRSAWDRVMSEKCLWFIVIDAVKNTQIFPLHGNTYLWRRKDVLNLIKNRNLVKED